MLQFLLIPTISFCLCKKRGWGKCGWVSANGQTNTWGKTDHRTLTHSWALCTFCRHHRAAAAVSLSHIYSQIGQKLFSPFPDPPCRPVWPARCGETVLAKATFPGHHHHQGDSTSLLTSHIFATVEHICIISPPGWEHIRTHRSKTWLLSRLARTAQIWQEHRHHEQVDFFDFFYNGFCSKLCFSLDKIFITLLQSNTRLSFI